MASIHENSYIESARGDEIHLSDYLSVVVENWRLVGAVAAVMLILGALYAALAWPIYQADAMIQVEDSAGSTKDALGDLASIFDTKQTAAAEIELIRSRLVVGQTVRKLHLDISAYPRHFPILGDWFARRAVNTGLARPFLGLKRFAWGGERISVSDFNVPSGLYDGKFTLTAGSGNTFDLTSPDGDPVLHGRVGEEARATLSIGTVQVKIDELVARPGTEFTLSRASTQRTTDALQAALTIVEKTKQSGVIGVTLEGRDSQRTSETVNTIAQAYVQQNIDRKSAEAEHTLSFLDQQLPELRKELDLAEDRYNTFRNKNGTVDLTEESRLLLQRIVEGKTKMIDLQQQRVEMAQRFTASHPSVVALDAQLGALQQEQDTLSRQVSALPDTEQAALRLLRDVRVDTELYTNLLNSAQQLRIIKAGEIGNVRVVDYAVAAESPIKPNRPLVIAFSLILGVVFGVAAVFLRKALYGGVEHTEQIEQALGMAVYAVVPHSQTQLRLQQALRSGRGGPFVLAAHAPEDVAIEGVRSLRTALQFGLLDSTNNIVMITGPRPEVGKSFLSVNLAVVLASGGKRVLLVDADMRRGDIHSYFGVDRSPGLSDVIAGGDIEEAVRHDVFPGLDVLPKGVLPPNPAELLMNDRLQTTLTYFSNRYDIVIVDTPPVLAVTDATLIGKLAGTTLLVVRHGRHPMSELAETVKRLRNGGVTLKGALFTDVPQRRIGYGAYYAGYYGYESRAD